MNAAGLLQHYDRIADAPDAVAKLRRLILDLAVRGKLVPQDPKDEPAAESLKRIAAKKQLNARKDRTSKVLKAANNMSPSIVILPAGWEIVPLAELVTVLNGRAYKQNELLSTGTPVLRVGNLFTSDKWYYSNLALEDDKYCEAGDLIFAWSASFGPFIWTGERVIYHYHIWKLELHSDADLDKNYVFKFLLQKTREIKEAGHGVSMLHMTKDSMERLVVALPPLAEQHRIVAKVDELMAQCDQVEAARAEREARRDRLAAASLARLNAPEPETFHDDVRFALDVLPAITSRTDQVKQLRETILSLAVRGQLVPQDPRDESAPKLLGRIRYADMANPVAIAMGSGQVAVENSGPIHPNAGWVWTSIGNCFGVSGGIQKTPARTPRSNSYPYLGVGNVYRGRLDLAEVKKFELAVGELERFRLEAGDILVVEGNGSASEIGRCAIWGGEIEDCVHQNHIIRCRPKVLELSTYAAIYLNSPDGRAEMTRLAITSAGLYSLSVGKIRSISLPLPPLAEQRRIIAKVGELMAVCDRLQASLNAGDSTRSRLLDALLHEALAPAVEMQEAA